jgi:predicted phage terminase large subunit-like protein
MRVHAQTALFEAGKVLFPNSAPWLAELERELLSFPGAQFDDQVDSVVQALDYATKELSSLTTWAALGR